MDAETHQFGNVTFRDVSEDYAQLALQGPKAMEILEKAAVRRVSPRSTTMRCSTGKWQGSPVSFPALAIPARTGWRLYLDSAQAEEMWEALLEAGKEEGLIPCGLGARDTLRMEAAMPLYGHEMDEEVTPLETGLGFAVKMAKEDFIGKKALEEARGTRT